MHDWLGLFAQPATLELMSFIGGYISSYSRLGPATGAAAAAAGAMDQ